MEVKLTDGTGNGYDARIDNNNRLHVDGVVRNQSQQAILSGDGFNFSTGVITLTSANKSALYYIKNDGDDPLIIKVVGLSFGATTGGSGNGLIELIANPTGGDIITTATALSTQANRNLGSSKNLVGSVFKGAEGATLTGGTALAATTRSSFPVVVNFEDDIFVIPKGTSLGVNYTPPSGNTSQTVVVFSTLFYERSDFNGQ